MTAPDTHSTASDNSVFQGPEDRLNTPVNDRALVQIIEHAYETASTTTRRDLEFETQWNATELDQFLDWLEAIGYEELIGDSVCQMMCYESRQLPCSVATMTDAECGRALPMSPEYLDILLEGGK